MPRLNLVRTAEWMGQEEGALLRRLAKELERMARRRAVPQSPLLQLRIDDVAVTLLLVRRMEGRLGDAEKCTASAIDAVGKTRERLRKTVKEFEDYLEHVGQPAPTNIAEAMAPIMLQIGDTLDQFWSSDDEEEGERGK